MYSLIKSWIRSSAGVVWHNSIYFKGTRLIHSGWALGLLLTYTSVYWIYELYILCCSQNIHWASLRVLLCIVEYYIILYCSCLHVCMLASFKIKGVLHSSFAAPLCRHFPLFFLNFLIIYIFIFSFPLSHLQHQSVPVSWMNIKSLSFFWPWSRSGVKHAFRRQEVPKILVIPLLPGKQQ